MIGVLLADDSKTARALLRELCARDPRLNVVGEAGDGREAVEQVALLKPSIVVMDIEMPIMDGIEATRQIMADTPTPILVVTAHHDARDVALSLRAVTAGALTVAPKPVGPGSPDFRRDAERFVWLVKALSSVRTVRRQNRQRDVAVVPPDLPDDELASRPGATRARAVGVAASTGGPAAVYRLLELLPARLAAPVLVVQHIADGFAPGLATWLSSGTPLPVKLAEHGELLLDGTVYIAPDSRHLQVTAAGRAALSDQPPVHGFRPSASVLFSSLAESYGAAAMGVVLTGMGNDGLQGARELRRVGAQVLAQDANSSVVFGMPRAVAEAGAATSVGTVEQLASRLAAAVAAKP